jgi:hypothetical protein
MVGGQMQTIIATAWSESGRFDDDEVEDALRLRLQLLGLDSGEMSWRRLKGRPFLHGRVNHPASEEEGDFALMRRAPVFYFVIISGASESYEATKKFRRRFIEEHFYPSAD